MKFIEYMEKIERVDPNGQGPESRVYRILQIDGGDSYPKAEMRMVGLDGLTVLFEQLWKRYEEWQGGQ